MVDRRVAIVALPRRLLRRVSNSGRERNNDPSWIRRRASEPHRSGDHSSAQLVKYMRSERGMKRDGNNETSVVDVADDAARKSGVAVIENVGTVQEFVTVDHEFQIVLPAKCMLREFVIDAERES